LAAPPAAPLPLAARRGCQSSAACRMMVQKDAELPRGKTGSPFAGLAAGVAAAALVFSPLQIGAVELPQGWAASTTEDGREYYYNTKTKQSQFTLPEGAIDSAAQKARTKRINDQNNLNKVEAFDALPAVPVDRVTVYEKPKLADGCGEEDYRVNSIECGLPAKNVVQDVAEKSAATISVLGDMDKEKAKAFSAAERSRMLQEAEMRALSKTDLFKKLDAKTKDPEEAAKRKKMIEEITTRNDIGASRAPWDPLPPEERPPPIKISIPDPTKMSLPNPFGGKKEDKTVAKKNNAKAAPAAAVDADADDDEEEE